MQSLDAWLFLPSQGPDGNNRPNQLLAPVRHSALLQFEHHWVAPDPIKNNSNNYRISESRYWSIDGILPTGFSATMKLEFDGRTTNGFLDLDLVPVNGDSIIFGVSIGVSVGVGDEVLVLGWG